MKWKTKRKLKNHIKSINWNELSHDRYNEYRKTGEYDALVWLSACARGDTGEPDDLFFRLLWNIASGVSEDPKHDAAFALTILPYCDKERR